MALTIGEVAGIINVGIVFCQFTFPLLLVFVLAGIIPERSNAITWSAAGRFLNASWWPTILGSDGAATSKVSTRVIVLSTLSTIGILLLAATAVVTPLGLYNAVTTTSVEPKDFIYATDLSPIGQATSGRDDYNTSRACGSLVWMSCPGQNHGFYTTSNESGAYLHWDSEDSYISTVVPQNLTALFSSGREGDRATVATPFDIEFRSYTLVRELERRQSVLLNMTYPPYQIDHYEKRTQADFQYGETILLADNFVISDGVIADMKKGGLGFRNHTIPKTVNSGVEWTESLLWLEPETVCVDNNLTVDFGIPEGTNTGSPEAYLVDYGGIANLPEDYPYIDLNETQLRPELYARAHKGAVLMNFNLRQQLGVSSDNRSHFGKTFLLSSTRYTPGVVNIGHFDNGIPGVNIPIDPRANITLLDQIDVVTAGYGGSDQANFSHIANVGGVVLGAFSNINKDNKNGRFDPGSNYSAPLYSCSTSIRAFIMNVTLFMNGTSALENLRVRSATPRQYLSNATKPLWAVENTGGMNISDVQPVWGLVDDEYEHDARLWTIRREHMYLPAGAASRTALILFSTDSLGCGGPINVLSLLYDGLNSPLSGGYPDFSGAASLPLKRKWQTLSETKDGIATMMALLWTDVAANYVTCSRSQLNANFSSVSTYVQRLAQNIPDTIQVNVLSYALVIRYRIPFAIAAFIYLSVYLVALFAALVMCISQKSTLHLLKSLLNQTSMGRAAVIHRYKEERVIAAKARYMSTNEWIRQYGGEDIDVVKQAWSSAKRKSSNDAIATESQSIGGKLQDNVEESN